MSSSGTDASSRSASGMGPGVHRGCPWVGVAKPRLAAPDVSRSVHARRHNCAWRGPQRQQDAALVAGGRRASRADLRGAENQVVVQRGQEVRIALAPVLSSQPRNRPRRLACSAIKKLTHSPPPSQSDPSPGWRSVPLSGQQRPRLLGALRSSTSLLGLQMCPEYALPVQDLRGNTKATSASLALRINRRTSGSSTGRRVEAAPHCDSRRNTSARHTQSSWALLRGNSALTEPFFGEGLRCTYVRREQVVQLACVVTHPWPSAPPGLRRLAPRARCRCSRSVVSATFGFGAITLASHDLALTRGELHLRKLDLSRCGVNPRSRSSYHAACRGIEVWEYCPRFKCSWGRGDHLSGTPSSAAYAPQRLAPRQQHSFTWSRLLAFAMHGDSAPSPRGSAAARACRHGPR